jgi:hypothetical protein
MKATAGHPLFEVLTTWLSAEYAQAFCVRTGSSHLRAYDQATIHSWPSFVWFNHLISLVISLKRLITGPCFFDKLICMSTKANCRLYLCVFDVTVCAWPKDLEHMHLFVFFLCPCGRLIRHLFCLFYALNFMKKRSTCTIICVLCWCS